MTDSNSNSSSPDPAPNTGSTPAAKASSGSGKLLWILFLVLACVGMWWSTQEGAQSPQKIEKRYEADVLYTEQPEIQEFFITVSDENREELGDSPREYVSADFRYKDIEIKDVGFRFKGHRSMRSWDSKPAFKIKFNHNNKEQRLLGLKKLTLNNMIEDPTMLQETLAYRLYRAAGVPAPRTAYAKVYVNDEYFGLYLNIETIDDRFLKLNFEDNDVDLYEGEYGCDIYPGDTPGFDHEEGDDEEHEGLISLIQEIDDDPTTIFSGEHKFNEAEALGYLAVSMFIGDFDGYRHSHNYRIYNDRKRDDWAFVPWGVDRVFRRDLALYDTGGRIGKLCFANVDCRRRYVERVQEVAAIFRELDLGSESERLEDYIADAMEADTHHGFESAKVQRRRKKLRKFLARRAKKIESRTECIVKGKPVDPDGDGHDCGDCNEDDPKINPGAPELCDGMDNDCDGLVDEGGDCDCPRVKVDGAEFLVCDFEVNWFEAEQICKDKGMTLARINTRAQAKKVHLELGKLSQPRGWIGFHDSDRDEEWEWVDGSDQKFERWAPGRPKMNGCSKLCAAFRGKQGGRWYNIHCGQRRPFVCRVPDDQVTASDPESASASTPSNGDDEDKAGEGDNDQNGNDDDAGDEAAE